MLHFCAQVLVLKVSEGMRLMLFTVRSGCNPVHPFTNCPDSGASDRQRHLSVSMQGNKQSHTCHGTARQSEYA